MEARVVDTLPPEAGWQFEPKWDGFRCLAFRAGTAVELIGKSGKSLSRYFPEMVEILRRVPCREFVLDGELVVPLGSSLSFDSLQARLHPAASRIRKLAHETPAIYIAFDCLAMRSNASLLGNPLSERRKVLEEFFHMLRADKTDLKLTPYTRELRVAQHWLDQAGGVLDGVVAKLIADSYQSGVRAMLKVKRMRTADCVVGGFRYASNSYQVGSLLLGLYNSVGKLDHVGFTSGISAAERASLTLRLERLIKSPGFTGDAPGGPSRWSTERSECWTPLAPKLVVEVQYDHITGKRFRHGTRLIRWRRDKSPRQCTIDQLEAEARPIRLTALLPS